MPTILPKDDPSKLEYYSHDSSRNLTYEVFNTITSKLDRGQKDELRKYFIVTAQLPLSEPDAEPEFKWWKERIPEGEESAGTLSLSNLDPGSGSNYQPKHELKLKLTEENIYPGERGDDDEGGDELMRAMSLDDFVPTTYLHPSPIANQDDGQSNPSSGSLTPRNAAMTPKGTSPESSTSPADISDESDEGEMNSDGGEVLSGSGGGQVEKSGEPFVEDDGIHPDEGVTRSRRGDEIRESGKHTVEEASGDGGETGQPIYEEECGENETAFVEAGNAGSA